MLARVAENVYWLSRYLERAVNTVRIVNVHSNLLMDLPAIDDHDGWIPLIAINGLDEEFTATHSRANEQTVCHFLLADKENTSSLLSAFMAISNNLRSCRDVMPKDSYEAINGLCRFVIENIDSNHRQPALRQSFLRTIENRLLSIDASLNNGMCHNLGYVIMRIGCYLERADMTSRIIDVQSTRLSLNSSTSEIMAIQAQRWVSVLRSLSAHQMYRQHIRRPVNGPDTLAFLLTNKQLPRSYNFCLEHLDGCLAKMKNNTEPRNAITTLQHQLEQADLPNLARNPIELHNFLDELQLGMLNVGAAITATYFTPAQESA
ncbi:MAG: alpha-E domain-containing protein [Granulosicoccus sp.]